MAAASGLRRPRDSGSAKPFLSHGFTGSGLVASHALAWGISSAAGTTSSTIFSFKASAGFTERPLSSRSSAAFTPAIRRRSEEHTSELQSLMRISYAVFCLKKKNKIKKRTKTIHVKDKITINNRNHY